MQWGISLFQPVTISTLSHLANAAIAMPLRGRSRETPKVMTLTMNDRSALAEDASVVRADVRPVFDIVRVEYMVDTIRDPNQAVASDVHDLCRLGVLYSPLSRSGSAHFDLRYWSGRGLALALSQVSNGSKQCCIHCIVRVGAEQGASITVSMEMTSRLDNAEGSNHLDEDVADYDF